MWPLLSWAASESYEPLRMTQGRLGLAEYCPYCSELVLSGYDESSGTAPEAWYADCRYCGWGQSRTGEGGCHHKEDLESQLVLVTIDAADLSVASAALRSAIVENPERVLDLSPRRTEELVASAFRDLGYEVVLTQQSKDGGRDVILLSRTDAEHQIVEVKRWSGRVDVNVVRQLRGVQLRDGAPTAILVSASGFTSAARREASASNPLRLGFAMELKTIRELLLQIGTLKPSVSALLAPEADRTEFRIWFGEKYGLTDEQGVIRNPIR